MHWNLITEHPYASADRTKPQLLYAAMDDFANDLLKLLDQGTDKEGKDSVRDPRLWECWLEDFPCPFSTISDPLIDCSYLARCQICLFPFVLGSSCAHLRFGFEAHHYDYPSWAPFVAHAHDGHSMDGRRWFMPLTEVTLTVCVYFWRLEPTRLPNQMCVYCVDS
jgi:hypothetical protein